MPNSASSGSGAKTRTRFCAGPAGAGRLESSAFGFPPGQPVMVCCSSLKMRILRLYAEPVSRMSVATVFGVVLVPQPQHRLMQIAGQRDKCFADKQRRPIDRADFPGKAESGQFSCGSVVNVASAIRVPLQEAGRYRVNLGAFDGLPKNRSLGFTPRKQDELLGFQDRSDAHGDSISRNILFAAEIPSRISASQAIERHHSGSGINCGAGFIEPDVSGASDAENLDIDPSGGPNFSLILLAVAKHFRTRDKAVWHVNIFRRNI